MSQEDPAVEEIYEVGTVAMVMRMLKLPDGRVKVLVQGVRQGADEAFAEGGLFYGVNMRRRRLR